HMQSFEWKLAMVLRQRQNSREGKEPANRNAQNVPQVFHRGSHLAFRNVQAPVNESAEHCFALHARFDRSDGKVVAGFFQRRSRRQQLTTLTASPPSEVSLYLVCMSMPVCRMVSITRSSVTRSVPSPCRTASRAA